MGATRAHGGTGPTTKSLIALLLSLILLLSLVTPSRASTESGETPSSEASTTAPEEAETPSDEAEPPIVDESTPPEAEPTETESPAEPETTDAVPTPDAEPSAEPSEGESITTQESDQADTSAAAAATSYWSVPFFEDYYLVDGSSVERVSSDGVPASAVGDASDAVRYANSSFDRSPRPIYAIIDWSEVTSSTAVTTYWLTPSDWARARADNGGVRPDVEFLDHVPGTTYLRYRSSTDPIARTPAGNRSPVTQAQYRAAGSPALTTDHRWFHQTIGTDDIWMMDSSRNATRLSNAQWIRWGSPRLIFPTMTLNRTTWSGSVYSYSYIGDAPVQVHWVTPAQKQELVNAGIQWDVRRVSHISGSRYYRWQSNNEVFVQTPDGHVHKMTSAEYENAGRPAAPLKTGFYVRPSWTNDVFFVQRIGQSSGSRYVSPSELSRQQNPTPRVVNSAPGSSYYRYWGTGTVYWSWHGRTEAMSSAEYNTAGRPSYGWRYYPIFVYGTLRPGYAAYDRYLAGNIQWQQTVRGRHLEMFYAPSRTFPYAIWNSNSSIVGTLIKLRTSYAGTIAALDRYENYDPNASPNSQAYNRVLVTTDNGHTAWAYVASESTARWVRATLDKVRSGDWNRR